MIVPIKRITKGEAEWLGTNYCKHGHTYLNHYDCFLKDKPATCPFTERVGYLDIEASNLNANFGYMFSYCIVDNDGKEYGRVLTKDEIRKGKFDEALCKEFIRDLDGFHRVVVFYGGDHRFDLPFLRTRCLKYRLDFPLYKSLWCTDLWPVCRNKLKLSSNRLETVCKFFGIKTKTHPMDFEIWCKALSGDEASLKYIWKHNVEDCVSLKEAYELIGPYSCVGKRSI